MDTNDTSPQSEHKCTDCRYAINVTGKCSFHDLPLIDAEKLSCEGRAVDFADGTSRPRIKPFTKKKSSAIETFLFGFLMACGAILFIMAFVLFTTSDDESWRGIWGIIGFFFLGGLGVLCFYGSLRHLRDIHAERRKAASKEQ